MVPAHPRLRRWRATAAHYNDKRRDSMTSKIDGASETLYRTQGMGQRIGFGERPAVLIIDMQHDFCDPDAATTLWPSIQTTYDPIRQLCAAARERRIPVFYARPDRR
jgi:hypothetical protein